MASFYLINTVSVGTTKVFAGDLIDDTKEDAAIIRAAGGLLWPSSDPVVAAAALMATNERLNRGANEERLNAIMQQAVDSVQLAEDAATVTVTTTLTAGTGLTGGGDLSANRTFNVVGNADGSIVANANDVQVGVLATDAQHGVRGGGTQHANVVAGGAAGFMTGAAATSLNALVTADTPVATPSALSLLTDTALSNGARVFVTDLNCFWQLDKTSTEVAAVLTGNPSLTFNAAARTLTRSAGSWLTDNFAVPSMNNHGTVTITGTASNNFTGTILTVTATVITFIVGTPVVNEGPNSGVTALDPTQVVITLSGTGRWLRVVEPIQRWTAQLNYDCDALLGSDLNSGAMGFTTASPALTFAASGFTITRGSGSWLTDGFLPGQRVTINDSSFNNVSLLTLVAATATVLTFGSSIVDEVASNVTITGTGLAPVRTLREIGRRIRRVDNAAVINYRAWISAAGTTSVDKYIFNPEILCGNGDVGFIVRGVSTNAVVGTFTTGTAAAIPATPAGGTAAHAADSVNFPATWATQIGNLLTSTSGPAIGAVAAIVKDEVTPGLARTSDWVFSRTGVFSQTPGAGALSGNPNLTFNAAARTVTRAAGSWLTDGFSANQSVTITGSASNNLTANTLAVTATVITFVVGTPVANEGPINGITVRPNDTYVIKSYPTNLTNYNGFGLVDRLSFQMECLTLTNTGGGAPKSIQYRDCIIKVRMQNNNSGSPHTMEFVGCCASLAVPGIFFDDTRCSVIARGSGFINCEFRYAGTLSKMTLIDRSIFQACSILPSSSVGTSSELSISGVSSFWDSPASAIKLYRGAFLAISSASGPTGMFGSGNTLLGIDAREGGVVNIPSTVTPNLTGLTGDINLDGLVTALPDFETSTQVGTGTLIAGVSAPLTANITAASRILITPKDTSGVSIGRLAAPSADRVVGGAGTFIVRSFTAAGVAETNDTSTFDWQVKPSSYPLTTWAQLLAAPFSRNAVGLKTGARFEIST